MVTPHTRRFMVVYTFAQVGGGHGVGNLFMNSSGVWPESGLVPGDVINSWADEIPRMVPGATSVAITNFIEIEPKAES